MIMTTRKLHYCAHKCAVLAEIFEGLAEHSVGQELKTSEQGLTEALEFVLKVANRTTVELNEIFGIEVEEPYYPI